LCFLVFSKIFLSWHVLPRVCKALLKSAPDLRLTRQQCTNVFPIAAEVDMGKPHANLCFLSGTFGSRGIRRGEFRNPPTFVFHDCFFVFWFFLVFSRFFDASASPTAISPSSIVSLSACVPKGFFVFLGVWCNISW
jgi:hypothetical protein